MNEINQPRKSRRIPVIVYEEIQTFFGAYHPLDLEDVEIKWFNGTPYKVTLQKVKNA